MINQGDSIPAERTSDKKHYFDHGEISLAFEYLLLEVMEGNLASQHIDYESIKRTALKLKAGRKAFGLTELKYLNQKH